MNILRKKSIQALMASSEKKGATLKKDLGSLI